MELSFLSLGSGSSGNCYYLGTEEYGLFVDAGINIREVKKILKENRIELANICGVLVTHEHADHIKTAGCLGEKYNIPVYATQLVHNGIDGSIFVKETLGASRRIIEKEKPFMIRDFSITAFEVPHDSVDNVGYHIEIAGEAFTFITDVGHITPAISAFASRTNHLVVEANYDVEMLWSGVYPQFLKERIAGASGHLSNQDAAEFIAAIYQPKLKDIWLCHISGDNNHPVLALKTVSDRLSGSGIIVDRDVSLTVLNRKTQTPVRKFEL